MNKDKNANGRVKFYIDRKSFWTQAAMILMVLSAIFRLVGCWGLWDDRYYAMTQIYLPIACNLLFVLCVFLFGRKGFWISTIPVLLGVVFFTIKSLSFDSWVHTILCILLYLLVAVLYTGTVFGAIRTKWLLPPLFGLPLLYHVLVEDLAAMRNTADPVTLSDGMLEISVLCIMAALLCVGIGLKKRVPMEEAELPKIKPPVVVPPAAKPEAAAGAEPAAETPEKEPAVTPESAEPTAETPAAAEPAAEDTTPEPPADNK